MNKTYRYDNIRLIESGEERLPKKGEYYYHLYTGILGRAAEDFTEEDSRIFMEDAGVDIDVYKILIRV